MTIVNCDRFSPLQGRGVVSHDDYGCEPLTCDIERNKVSLITDVKDWFLNVLMHCLKNAWLKGSWF